MGSFRDMPGTRNVLVTTLTPVLDEERHIRATVDTLRAQDVADQAEFIFVDGRSRDRTRAILEELAREDPRIRVLENPARQTATALNIGLREAAGEYVARVDAHASFPPTYLSTGIKRLERGDVAWVAGPPVPVGRRGWSKRVALALGTPLGTGGSNHWQRDVAQHGGGEVELGTGVFAGIWRRSTLDRYHGWDEGWPINQDSELAARVAEDGHRIVSLPSLAAEYEPRDSLRRLARQYARYGMYRAKTGLRHPGTVRPVHLAMPGIVVAGACALAAPGALRRAAREALLVYAALVAAQSARTAGASRRDALALPAVFVTMHVAWGAGYLAGLVRFAPPSRRRPALADDLARRSGTAA
jgi:cellulose synthase/poly-beta-1,6-N-acetylglucosamine synthase-like glycosyltransferase